MPKGYSLTAVVLSFNAERKIGSCFKSLAGWTDEVVLVDGGSTDNTLRIAQSFGVQVYAHPFLGSFAQERNFGAEKVRGDWVLQLDSDEVVSEYFKAKCNEILTQTKYVAFKFRRKNFFLGHSFQYGGWYHWSQHLYRKGFAYYEGRVHERMIVKGEVGFIDADILHYPFDSVSEFIERQNRYTDLQAQDIFEKQDNLNMRQVKYNLALKPLKLFKKMYFDKRGYREGIYGLIFSTLFSYVHFLKWAKVRERLKSL